MNFSSRQLNKSILNKGSWEKCSISAESIHGTGVDDLKLPAVAAPLDFLKAVEGASSETVNVDAKNARRQEIT